MPNWILDDTDVLSKKNCLKYLLFWYGMRGLGGLYLDECCSTS